MGLELASTIHVRINISLYLAIVFWNTLQNNPNIIILCKHVWWFCWLVVLRSRCLPQLARLRTSFWVLTHKAAYLRVTESQVGLYLYVVFKQISKNPYHVYQNSREIWRDLTRHWLKPEVILYSSIKTDFNFQVNYPFLGKYQLKLPGSTDVGAGDDHKIQATI